jgi:hypothetical protein
MLEQLWAPSCVLLLGNSLLALLEFSLSEKTAQVYWSHNFPEILCPVLFGPNSEHAVQFLARLRRAPKLLQCLAAVLSNWLAGTLFGIAFLVFFGLGGIPPYHMSIALLVWEVVCGLVLLGQIRGVVPVQWRGTLLLHACMYFAAVVVLGVVTVESMLLDLLYTDIRLF